MWRQELCSNISQMEKAKGEQEHFSLEKFSCRKQVPCGNNNTRIYLKVTVHSWKVGHNLKPHVVEIRWSFLHLKHYGAQQQNIATAFSSINAKGVDLLSHIFPNTIHICYKLQLKCIIYILLKRLKKKNQISIVWLQFPQTRNLITLNAIEIFIRQGKISSSSRQILETVIRYIQNMVLDSTQQSSDTKQKE